MQNLNTIVINPGFGNIAVGTTNFDNKAVNLQMQNANVTGGDGTFTFVLYYTIEKTT